MNEERKHKNSFKSDGHLDDNAIAACSEWLSNGSSVIDSEILEHLDKCLLCKQQVIEVAEIIDEDLHEKVSKISSRERFEETCAAKNSPSIKLQAGGQFWKVAAIFFALITVTALTLILKPKKNPAYVNTTEQNDTTHSDTNSNEEELPEKEKDSSESLQGNNDQIKIIEVEENKFAKNFKPNPGYEALIGAQFRAGDNARVNIPAADTSLFAGSTITFIGVNPQQNILELQILNNRAEVLKKIEGVSAIQLDISFDYDPGLYYWKLLNEEELIQIGKLFLLENK